MRLRANLAIVWSIFFLGGFLLTARAQEPAPAPLVPTVQGTIKIARISGEVFAIDHATGLKTRLSLSSLVNDGQTVSTGQDASVVLVFSNGAVVNVKANAELSVVQFLQNPFSQSFRIRDAIHEPSVSITQLELRKGEIVSQVKKLNRDAGSSFTVETPVGAAGIRGTAFSILYQPTSGSAHFLLTMAEGLIRFIPTHGHAVEVPAGREVSATAEIDLSTGKLISMSDLSALLEVSPAAAAALQQSVADELGAAMNIQFSPATGGANQSSNGNNPANTQTPTATDPTASPSSPDENASNPVASPPAVPPAQRTTPGDGV